MDLLEWFFLSSSFLHYRLLGILDPLYIWKFSIHDHRSFPLDPFKCWFLVLVVLSKLCYLVKDKCILSLICFLWQGIATLENWPIVMEQHRWAGCVSRILQKYRKLDLKINWMPFYTLLLTVHFKRFVLSDYWLAIAHCMCGGILARMQLEWMVFSVCSLSGGRG